MSEKWRWRLIGLWIALFSGVVIIAWEANQNRIHDIQQAKIDSCITAYEGIRQVVRPLIPPIYQRDIETQLNVIKFNHTIDRFKKQCENINHVDININISPTTTTKK